jgi:uncharacterized protein (TIGR00369 family)
MNMQHETEELKVAAGQNISRMCFVCGTDNHMGLHTQFLELEDGRLCALFTAQEEHQSYPGRVHGGVLSAIIDEVIGRTIQIKHPEVFGVTIELTVKFRKPVPYGVPLKVIAKLTKDTARSMEGEAELVLEDGSVAVQGWARYLKLSVDTISEGGLSDDDWFNDERPIPEKITI